MRQLALLIALIAAAPAWAGGNETSFPAAPDGTVQFVTPSGNIGCLYMPAGGTATYATLSGQEELHCTRVAPTYTVVILDHAQDHPAAIASGEVPGLDAGPVLPAGLAQPELHLPWKPGEWWHLTGGPHGGWASGAGWAARRAHSGGKCRCS